MNAYDLVMKPIESFILHDIRAKLIPLAEKDVLEIGIGTGVNLPYYSSNKINKIVGLDKDYSKELERFSTANFSFMKGDIEKLPFPDNTFDTVVLTLVLCSTDFEKSLQEIKRVLKPEGTFIFLEHVRPHGVLAGRITDKLNRVWPKIAHGCNLNRPTDKLLQDNQFSNINMQHQGVFCYGYAKK